MSFDINKDKYLTIKFLYFYAKVKRHKKRELNYIFIFLNLFQILSNISSYKIRRSKLNFSLCVFLKYNKVVFLIPIIKTNNTNSVSE